jgi:hypothetical protein
MDITLLELLTLAYLAIGAVVAIWVLASDAYTKRTTGVGLLANISLGVGFFFLLFSALWPVWVILRCFFHSPDKTDSPSSRDKKA